MDKKRLTKEAMLLALCAVLNRGVAFGVTASYYINPLMTNSVDVIVEKLGDLPLGHATIVRELSTNEFFRANDIACYIFTNDFAACGDYQAISRRLGNCSFAARWARHSCNLRQSASSLILQSQFFCRLDTLLESENLLSNAYHSAEARQLAESIFQAKFSLPIFGLDSIYANIDLALTNGCDLAYTNSLPLPEQEIASAMATSGLFEIRGINVPVVSPSGDETNFISIVATAIKGEANHIFLLDLSNYGSVIQESKGAIAANALRLNAIKGSLWERIPNNHLLSIHAISIFPESEGEFGPSFVHGLFCNATNLPTLLKKRYFLTEGNPNWIDSQQNFTIQNQEAYLLNSTIPDYVLEPSVHDYINEMMEKSASEIVEALSSFSQHTGWESLAAELSSNTTFRAEDILIALCSRDIPTNSIEAASNFIYHNNLASLVLSWSCNTNYSGEARMAESNYIARISALLDAYDCYGEAGVESAHNFFRKSGNDAAFAYSVTRRSDILGALESAISYDNVNTNRLPASSNATPLAEIFNAIAALDGFRVCATNVPFFNPFGGTNEYIDAIVCQQGRYRKEYFLVSAKFFGRETPPSRDEIIAEIVKLDSLGIGIMVNFYTDREGLEAPTQYIPCILLDSRPELTPYRIITNFALGRGLLLWGTPTEMSKRFARMRIW